MSGAAADAGRLMDSIYARQRHIYDATRKFYLLGRDETIAGLAVPRGGSVLEIGCGTGRNLVKIARRYPDARCFGVDLSSAMLETASASIARAGLAGSIAIAQGDATRFDPQAAFGVAKFDRIVISYALSMIPPWRDALRHVAGLLAPGGSLHLVDFGGQSRMPKAFAAMLEAWLARFHVSIRCDLPDEAATVARDLGLACTTRPLYRTYAVGAVLSAPAGSGDGQA